MKCLYENLFPIPLIATNLLNGFQSKYYVVLIVADLPYFAKVYGFNSNTYSPFKRDRNQSQTTLSCLQ